MFAKNIATRTASIPWNYPFPFTGDVHLLLPSPKARLIIMTPYTVRSRNVRVGKNFEGKKTCNNLEEKSRKQRELCIQKAKHIYLSWHHQSQADRDEWPCNWVWVQRKILLRIHHWWAISREHHTTGYSEQKVRKIQSWSKIHDQIISTWTTPYPPLIIFSLLCLKSCWWSVRLPSRNLCFSGSAENVSSSRKHSWLGLE